MMKTIRKSYYIHSKNNHQNSPSYCVTTSMSTSKSKSTTSTRKVSSSTSSSPPHSCSLSRIRSSKSPCRKNNQVVLTETSGTQKKLYETRFRRRLNMKYGVVTTRTKTTPSSSSSSRLKRNNVYHHSKKEMAKKYQYRRREEATRKQQQYVAKNVRDFFATV